MLTADNTRFPWSRELIRIPTLLLIHMSSHFNGVYYFTSLTSDLHASMTSTRAVRREFISLQAQQNDLQPIEVYRISEGKTTFWDSFFIESSGRMVIRLIAHIVIQTALEGQVHDETGSYSALEHLSRPGSPHYGTRDW